MNEQITFDYCGKCDIVFPVGILGGIEGLCRKCAYEYMLKRG